MALWQLPWSTFLGVFVLGSVICVLTVLVLVRILSCTTSVPKWRSRSSPGHLLVVLGSGGHTAEMFSMLRRIALDPSQYSYRTYVVSSGDNFSAAKAAEFERTYLSKAPAGSYAIVTVPRARRVHQSYLTAPISTLQSFWSCLLLLCSLHPDQALQTAQIPSPYPDVIITNGPATGVCVLFAAKLLRLCLYAVLHPQERRLRTIFVESWARVTTLSLSGKLMLPFADRFLVQWPALGGKRAWLGIKEAEYVGTLVD